MNLSSFDFITNDIKYRELITPYIKDISTNDFNLLKNYIIKRYTDKHEKNGLNIVFDISKYCNLSCIGCCVNAKLTSKNEYDKVNKYNDLSFLEISSILYKVRRYSETLKNDDVYINYGGGEPFIRNDFNDLVKLTKSIFPNGKIAVDTNGTIGDYDSILEIKSYLEVIGFSIDGMKETHNKWRGVTNYEESFDKIISVIEKLLKDPEMKGKIEVTTVASTSNLKEIPDLAKFLARIGVKKFSVHRAMPVGRMRGKPEKIPTAKEYLDLFVELIKISFYNKNIDIHMHHSIESIYASLLFGINTFHQGKINSNLYSSLAISSKGNVFLDPWVTDAPWNKLTIGSLKKDVDIIDLIHDSNKNYSDIVKYQKKEIRCRGCKIECSGGSRVSAAYSSMHSSSSNDWSKKSILSHLGEIDPACFLSELQL